MTSIVWNFRSLLSPATGESEERDSIHSAGPMPMGQLQAASKQQLFHRANNFFRFGPPCHFCS
jgi:hypothetical protein